MAKERVFTRQTTVKNFRQIKPELLPLAGRSRKGRQYSELAELIAEVYFTPMGYRAEIHFITSMEVWDKEHADKVMGICQETPFGDLDRKNFETPTAAMQFVTRRLKKLGWDPVGRWEAV